MAAEAGLFKFCCSFLTGSLRSSRLAFSNLSVVLGLRGCAPKAFVPFSVLAVVAVPELSWSLMRSAFNLVLFCCLLPKRLVFLGSSFLNIFEKGLDLVSVMIVVVVLVSSNVFFGLEDMGLVLVSVFIVVVVCVVSSDAFG